MNKYLNYATDKLTVSQTQAQIKNITSTEPRAQWGRYTEIKKGTEWTTDFEKYDSVAHAVRDERFEFVPNQKELEELENFLMKLKSEYITVASHLNSLQTCLQAEGTNVSPSSCNLTTEDAVAKAVSTFSQYAQQLETLETAMQLIEAYLSVPAPTTRQGGGGSKRDPQKQSAATKPKPQPTNQTTSRAGGGKVVSSVTKLAGRIETTTAAKSSSSKPIPSPSSSRPLVSSPVPASASSSRVQHQKQVRVQANKTIKSAVKSKP